MPYSLLRKAVAVAVSLMLLAGATQAAGISFKRTYDEALRSARSSKKLLMIDFYADWCGYCKKLEAEVFPDARVARLADRFVAVRLNAEREGADLAQQYGVAGLPTIVFIDGQGEMVGKIRGFLPAEPFAGRVERILTIHAQLPGLESQLRSNPADAKVASRLVGFYVQLAKRDKAIATLERMARSDPQNRSGKLARAFNEVGDFHQANRAVREAMGYYQKALQASHTPQDRAYAQMSVAYCHANLNDLASARKAFEKTVAIVGCPTEIKTEAQKRLTQLSQILR